MKNAIIKIQNMLKQGIELTQNNLKEQGIETTTINSLEKNGIIKNQDGTYRINKLRIIYDMVIAGIPLTLDNMLDNNMTSEEINDFISKKHLLENEDGTYRINESRLDPFYRHVKSRKDLGETSLDLDQICYILNPSFRISCINLMIKDIEEGNLSKAFERFMFMYLNENKEDKKVRDDSLFLFLFSQIMDLPEEINGVNLREKAKSISIEDIELDKTNPETKPENEIRKNLFWKKFSYVDRLISERKKFEPASKKIDLLEKLAKIGQKRKKEIIENLLKYITANQFEAARELLQENEKIRQLSEYERLLLKLIEIYIEIKKTGIIPEVKSNDFEFTKKKNTTFQNPLLPYIERNDFHGALTYCKKMRKGNEVRDSQIELVLLLKICDLIDKLQKEIEPIAHTESINAEQEPEVPTELKTTFEEVESWYYYTVDNAVKNQISFNEEIKKLNIINKCLIDLIKLYAAIECYRYLNISNGDSYLKEVEESNQSSDEVKKFIEYVKKIKAYYKQIKIKIKTYKKTINIKKCIVLNK